MASEARCQRSQHCDEFQSFVATSSDVGLGDAALRFTPRWSQRVRSSWCGCDVALGAARDLVQCSVGLLRASRAMANCLGTAQSDAPWLPLTFHRVRLRQLQGGLQPDVVSYSSVISGCAQVWQLALELLVTAATSVQLDAQCCTTAIRACAEAQPFGSGTTVGTVGTGGQSARSSFDHGTMVLPMSLLRTAQNQPMMVELKNGETYSGVLASCDGFMNLHMRDIVCTSRDGERFWKIPECYVRGNSIKYLRLPDEVIDMVKDEPQSRKEIRQQFKARGRGRGKGEGRGRGRGGQSAGPEKRAGGGGDKAGKKARP
ncbi:unnamed protein product [Cladocopium goreaui]|uniref:U6 snRNA-associated Sm-like protein LSm4 n=1 Tax=Cladocopium goreaui TaxID=2562237 RepID=A0A9P1DA61_9DINO|nr:unnamed protein product [Cladocopium goreaui]